MEAKREYVFLKENCQIQDFQSKLFLNKKGEKIVSYLLREVMTFGLSTRVLDLNVCGAIVPYNNLLGGKLVALAFCSQEIQNEYSKRYDDAASIISSYIKGSKVVKPTNIEIITTTSLYGSQSSQYNRLKLSKKIYDIKTLLTLST